MEKFTAAQAREMMPDRVKEIVEKVHNYVRTAAKKGQIETEVSFSSNMYIEGSAWKAAKILEEEGFHVTLTKTGASFDYSVNWREH